MLGWSCRRSEKFNEVEKVGFHARQEWKAMEFHMKVAHDELEHNIL